MASEETYENLQEKIEESKESAEENEVKIGVALDEKKTQEAMKELEESFKVIKKKFESIGASIRKSLNDSIKTACGDVKKEMEAAFTITNPEEYAAAAERFGEGVAGALASANENMDALEDSIVNTTAPVAGAVASMLNEVLPSVTSLVDGLKQTISDAITNVQPLITWLWDSFLQPIAQWTVGVLKEILEAVLGIHIGDAEVGRAVQRYQQKMAVVYGRPY